MPGGKEYQDQQGVSTWRRPDDMILKYLRVDGTGSVEMAVDGSATPVNFDLICPGPCRLHLMTIFIQDQGIKADEFGGLGSALTNGLLIEVRDDKDNLLLDPTDGTPIKANAAFSSLTGSDLVFQDAAGMSQDLFTALWIINATGAGLWMDKNWLIRFVVRDDLTSLNFFRCFVHGVTL